MGLKRKIVPGLPKKRVVAVEGAVEFNADSVLPFEVVHEVLLLVDAKTRCRCCLVSRRWNRVLYNSPGLWRILDLSNRQTLGGEKFMDLDPDSRKNVNATLLRLTSTASLFNPFLIPTTPLVTLPSPDRPHRFSRITRLDLSCTFFDPVTFSHPDVSSLLAPSLTTLSLNGCPLVTSGTLYYLRVLINLVSLDLSHCDGVDDMGLEILARFVGWLRALNLSYLFKVTDVGVKRLFKMNGLTSLNLMGCCRIKSYPWAISNDHPRSTLPIKEVSIGEDSRIQTRGFWLLWCTWQQWDMGKIVRICPFLETLRLNMVLFDLPSTGLETLLTGCLNLKTLSLVVDRNIIPALCQCASLLAKLNTLDLTIHIGVTAEHFKTLVDAGALMKLKALKFHSKHTNVFKEMGLEGFVKAVKKLEFLELNGEDFSPDALLPIAPALGAHLQSLLMHHFQLSNASLSALSKSCTTLRELTLTDVQPIILDSDVKLRPPVNRISMIVSDPGMALRLKKIEISSAMGSFCDKDLANIPAACKNLQWADFQFPFTFPKTTTAIANNCPNLLFLRLAKTSTPCHPTTPTAPTSPPPSPRRSSTPRRASFKQTPLPPQRRASTTTAHFLNSSPESQSLIHLSLHSPRLRVLDVTGDLGLTDHVLQKLSSLPSIHTVFLDGVQGVTEKGVLRFCEGAWRSLKRLHVRGCRGVKVGCVMENFVVKGLEVDLVVDGGRGVGGSNRFSED